MYFLIYSMGEDSCNPIYFHHEGHEEHEEFKINSV